MNPSPEALNDFQNRYALILANYKYADPGLQQLVAPARDARALGGVLGDPAIGGFKIEQMLINKPSHVVNQAVEAFFANRKPDDVLLLYFSGHGVKDDDGRLYLAVANSYRNLLRSTSLPAALVNDVMRRSRSRRQILLLDCCYSGAFARGAEVKSAGGPGSPMGTNEQFDGRGRVVLTASDALQYAFEGDEIRGTGAASVFTRALVEGLAKGSADRNRDGLITLDELYDYVFERVSELAPQQVPEKWDFGVQGGLVIARNPKAASTGEPHEPARAVAARSAARPASVVEDEGGIYITRMFAEKVGDYGVRRTVWITARGPLQYTLDSARVYHQVHGVAGPVANVAVPPDAEYQFTYNDSSDYIAALNPALSIGPETRRVASFIFSTAPDKPIYTIGSLKIWVRYQASDGRTGALLLEEPRPYSVELARLLGRDVQIETDRGVQQVVTPRGLSRGLEEDHRPELRHRLVELDGWRTYYHKYSRRELLARREAARRILGERQALHRALSTPGALSVLREKVVQGDKFWSDLLGGVASTKSTKMLEDLLQVNPVEPAALYGYCVRHLVKADSRLAAHVLKHRALFQEDRDAIGRAVAALELEPAGDWVEVMALWRDSDQGLSTLDILIPLQGDMNTDEVERLVDPKLGPLDTEMYLRGSMHAWANPPPEQTRLQHLGGGKYSASLQLEPGVYEFKFGNAFWTHQVNFGVWESGQSVSLGTPFSVIAHALSKNLRLEISTTGEYSFDLDASDLENVTAAVSLADRQA